ncbi:MAG: hypothetical protein U0Y96_06560 [Candidatus Kapaibacterium sp.]|nr:hypothetical protein [Bacteroidota bacterium]
MKSWTIRQSGMFAMLVTVTTIFCSSVIFAQSNEAGVLTLKNSYTPTTPPAATTAKTEAPAVTLKPTMSVGDVAFVLSTLNTVNVNGSEVAAFMEVKSVFTKALDVAQKANKKENDAAVVELNIPQANAYWELLKRATVSGALADKFQSVQNAIVDAAKAVEASTPKNMGSK